MINRETTIHQETLYEGTIVTLEKHQVITDLGQRAKREIVRHAHGVVILGRLANGGYIFLEQFRKPFEEAILELPAGKLDPGEDPDQAAAREFQEETGYLADNLRYLGQALPSPGFCDEIIHCYACDAITKKDIGRDADESFDTFIFTEEDIRAVIKEGRLRDAKSMVCLFYAGVSL